MDGVNLHDMPMQVAAAVTVELIERGADTDPESHNFKAGDRADQVAALRRSREARWKKWDNAISGRDDVLEPEEKARQLADLYASLGFGGANSLGDGS